MSKSEVVVELDLALVANWAIVTFMRVGVTLDPCHLMSVLAPWLSWATGEGWWVGCSNLDSLWSIDYFSDGCGHLDNFCGLVMVIVNNDFTTSSAATKLADEDAK